MGEHKIFCLVLAIFWIANLDSDLPERSGYGAHINAPLFAHLNGTFHSQSVLIMQ